MKLSNARGRSVITFLIALLIPLHALAQKELPTTFRIDPSLENAKETLPGLNGAEPRPISVIVGPSGRLTEIVANEVVFHPSSDKELQAFLARYDGVILRDGMPFVLEPIEKDDRRIASDGWYLIRINPKLSEIDDLEKNLGMGSPTGEYRFSSEEAARHFALLLRERDLAIAPNLVLRPQSIPEHPKGDGTFFDAAGTDFPWFLEDDEPNIPGEQGWSTGVIHAWDYLRYKGFPPQNGTYRPARIAILDGGFALAESGDGQPLDGNLDYGLGMMQADVIDQDGYAGGPATFGCTGGSVCRWHGQGSFSVAAAEPGNHFGSAGSGGPVVWPLLVRTNFDGWSLGDAIRTASISGADVMSISLKGDCGDACQFFPDNIRARLDRAVALARSTGQVVVAAAGNESVEISSGDTGPLPCNVTGVICVGSVSRGGTNIFNFGSAVDIWAPTNILATVSPESAALDADSVGRDELVTHTGTSASTPFIAGVIGLMKVLDPAISPQRVLDILQMTANHGPDPLVSMGWVDAFRAVQAVRPNQPPVVQWQGPASGAIPWTGVSLSALASDPEVAPGNELQWPVTVTFKSSIDGLLCTDSTPPFGCFSGALSLGNHVLTVTATDAFGATSSAIRNFQVVNRPPAPHIAAPLTNGTYFAHQMVTLEALVIDPDESISENSVVWSSNHDGVLGIGWSRDVSLSAGAHVITVVATDAKGATGQDSVAITVQSGDGFPSVSILEPGAGLSVTPGTVITLRGSAFDPEDHDLTGASLVWSSDRDGLLGTGQTLHVVLSGPATPCSAEIVTHVVTLRATDSAGHAVEVTVRISVGMVC